MHRIHIVGSSPRTGTTLLHELVVHGFVVAGAGEHERSIFRRPRHEGEVCVTKDPQDVLVAARLLAIDPDLCFLHMVRDPRDVVVSRHGRRPERYWSTLALWKLYHTAARRAEGHPRFLTLRYEDLVRDPDAAQERIAAFLPFLKRRGAFSEVHRVATPPRAALVALGGLRAVAPDRIGSWKAHLPRVAAQIARHGSLDADLVALGYEPDGRWREILRGVAPDNGESQLLDRRLGPWRRTRLEWRMARRVRRYRRRLRQRTRTSPQRV